MTSEEAFLALHRDMTRQGPGTPEDVHWALSHVDLPEHPRVVDAGCGPGADLETLAGALPMGILRGVEQLPHLADEARARCARFTNVTVETGDMAALEGPCDLIWCAGAIYFLGVTEALTHWRSVLAPGGAVAFSEPVLEADAPKAARDFWAEEPGVTDMDGLKARIDAAGYEILGQRPVTGIAWAGYYSELSARIAALRPGADAVMSEVLDAAEREVALWRAAPGDIAYALMLVRPALRVI